MNTKMKLLTITLVSLFSCVLAGCGNSSPKQQAIQNTQKEYPLAQIFKEAYGKGETLSHLLRNEMVKERIIKEYNTNFYNKALEYAIFVYDLVYKDGKYIANGTSTRLGDESVDLTYDPTSDLLTVQIMEQDRIVQRDGEIYYNTEGWDVNVYEEKNDFNEVVKREPISRYLIRGKEYTYSKNKFVLVMRLNYITLWTNEDNMMTGVKDIRVKDHDSGTIYNIAFDQPFFHKNGGAMNADIGVAIFDKNEADFINLISGLNNYTISIRSESGELLTLTNPENFNNIRDVYLKLVQMWEDMKK